MSTIETSIPVKTGRALLTHDALSNSWTCRYMTLAGEVRDDEVMTGTSAEWEHAYDLALERLLAAGVHRKSAGEYRGPTWPAPPAPPAPARGPMPTVTYDGSTYKLRSRKTVVPNLDSMERMAALIWINQNTTKRGHHAVPSPLLGMAGAVGLQVR